MKLSPTEYKQLYKSEMPRSKAGKDLALAFLVGGGICTLGQLIKNMWLTRLSTDKASLMTSVTLVLISALLTILGVYDKIARHAGAGTLVPITGFANSVVSPAIEFKSEGFIVGTGCKMFIICGPVIVYGTSAAIAAGILSLLLGGLG